MSSHPSNARTTGGARAVLVARDLAQQLIPDIYRAGRELWQRLQRQQRAWVSSAEYAAREARTLAGVIYPPLPTYTPYVHPMNLQVVPYVPLYPTSVLPHQLMPVPSHRSMRMRIAHTPLPVDLPNYRSLRKEAKQLGEVAQRVKKRHRFGWKKEFQFMPLPAYRRPYRYWPYHYQRERR